MSTLTDNGQPTAVASPDPLKLETPMPPEGEPLRLNIGGGENPIEGFVTVDRKNGVEAYPLPYPDGVADEIYASHIIEHFPVSKVALVLNDWIRVLKPGGRLRISTPDLQKVAHCVTNRIPFRTPDGTELPWGVVLSGGQTDDNDFHKAHMDYADLSTLFAAAGLVGVRPFRSEFNDCSQYDFCANIEGTKPSAEMEERAVSDRVIGCRTIPRLGWTRTAERMASTATRCGVEFISTGGAYADLGFERALERATQVASSTGRDYVLMTDYDTIWEPSDVVRLIVLMDVHPEADAIAAIQLRRGVHHVLFSGDKDYTLDSFADELVRVRTSHFGCTIFRASAFKDLPKPWFRHRDNDDGSCTEADMTFWEKWNDAGNTLYIAGHVPVGHMEEFVVWPGQNLEPIYQPDLDFDEHGKPFGVRQ